MEEAKVYEKIVIGSYKEDLLLGSRSRLISSTAWKVSKYGVFSGPYFPVFGPNTEIYLHIWTLFTQCSLYQPVFESEWNALIVIVTGKRERFCFFCKICFRN